MEENELNERLNELAKVKDWQSIVEATENINEVRLVIDLLQNSW